MSRATSWRRKSNGMFLKLRKTVVRSFKDGREGLSSNSVTTRIFSLDCRDEPSIPFPSYFDFIALVPAIQLARAQVFHHLGEYIPQYGFSVSVA